MSAFACDDVPSTRHETGSTLPRPIISALSIQRTVPRVGSSRPTGGSDARIAQLVERKALNLVVMGSSPISGALLFWIPGKEEEDTSAWESVGITQQGRIQKTKEGGAWTDAWRTPMGTWTEHRNKEKGPNERERFNETIALPSLVMQDDAPTKCFERSTMEVLSGEEQRTHLLIVACACLHQDGTAASLLQKQKYRASQAVALGLCNTTLTGANRRHEPFCTGRPMVSAVPRSYWMSEHHLPAHERRTRDLCGPIGHGSP